MSKFEGLALAVDTPQRMTILHPGTAAPLRDESGGEAWIELVSADSAVAERFESRAINARLQRPGRPTRSFEELRAERAQQLAAMTAGWRLVGLDGAPIDLPFTEAAALELYQARAMAWLREQVEAFLANRANFLPGSSRS